MFQRKTLSVLVAAVIGLGVSAPGFAKIGGGDVAREAAEGPRQEDRRQDRREDRRQDRRDGRAATQDGASTMDVAREAGSRGRGRGRDGVKEETTEQIAREGGVRGRGRGAAQDEDSLQIIAREAGEAPRGRDNERPGDRQRGRGRNGVAAEVIDQIAREGGSRGRSRGAVQEDESVQIIAREAGEAPRGRDNERPGDRQRGRGAVQADDVQIIAREAGEAPRGRDNERPGDRQRGRGAAQADDVQIIAREAGEAPRGRDNERPGDRQRGRNA